jgi:hypothetical protein
VADARRHLAAAETMASRLDDVGMLRGDALLEQYRRAIIKFERPR